MIFGAIIGLFQVILLPGLVADRIFKPDIRFIPRLLGIFILSLLVNSLLSFFLVAIHSYTQSALMIIFLGEIIVLVACEKASLKRGWQVTVSDLFERTIKVALKEFAQIQEAKSYKYTILGLGLLGLAYYFVMWIGNFGAVFQEWDAVVSWNRWAVDWSNNRYPANIWHYGQVLPTAWSTIYVCAGYPLQFFPKIMMPLFILLVILIHFDLSLKAKDLSFLVGAIGLMILYDKVFGKSFLDGYVDVPVSVVAFSALAFTLYAFESETEPAQARCYLILGAIAACTAGVIKQAGAFVTIVYPIFLWFYFANRKAGFIDKRTLKQWTIYYILAVLIIDVAFYLYTEWRIHSGLDSSEISFVTQGIYQGKSYFDRFIAALMLLVRKFSYIFSLIVLLFCGVAITKSAIYRHLFLAIFLPYFFIWALFFSYDPRNLSIAYPYISLGIGFGVQHAKRHISMLFVSFTNSLLKRKAFGLVAAAGLLVVVLSTNILSSDNLIKRHNQLLRSVGKRAVNEQLYKYYDNYGFSGKIVTDYQYLGFIPILSDYYQLVFFEKTDGKEYSNYLRNIENQASGYLLFQEGIPVKEIQEDIKARVVSGQFVIVFKEAGYVFIKIIR